MNRVKSEDDCEMVLEDEMDSPPPAVVSPPSGPPQNKGPWTAAEDSILLEYIKKHGKGNWNAVQRNTGLSRCGKSCRLRWANHLRPNLKKGAFTPEEENLVIQLHHKMGNRWAKMATRLPGRTDNEIKNFWNTRVKRCERADLPVYPASIVGQSSTEDEPVSDDINSGENMARDFLENYLNGNGLILPDFTSDNFISDALSYGPQLSADSISNLLDQSYASSGWSFTDQVDNFKQSGSVLPALSNTFDGVLPSVDLFSNDSETVKQTVAPFGVSLPHSHAFLNGTFSASGPINGPLKMELPSFQDVEAYQNTWPKHFEAPAMQPRNNGLLEELLHEARVVRSGMNQQQTVTCSSSSATKPYYETATAVSPDMCPEYWEDHRTSLLNEYAPFSGSSFTESTPFSAASPDIFQLSNASPAQSASMVSCDQIPELRYESGGSFHPENLMPDALFTENYTTDASVFSDGVPMVLDDDMSSIWSNMLQTYEPLEYE